MSQTCPLWQYPTPKGVQTPLRYPTPPPALSVMALCALCVVSNNKLKLKLIYTTAMGPYKKSDFKYDVKSGFLVF